MSLPGKLRAKDRAERLRKKGAAGLRGERDRIRVELAMALERAALEGSALSAVKVIREWAQMALRRDHRVRVTEERKKEILRLAELGWKAPTIARMTGVGQKTVRMLING
jgi:DNA-binding NarL/FixJ family response regulator